MEKRIFMESELIDYQKVFNQIEDHPCMQRSDDQLAGQVKLSCLYQDRYQGSQPESLKEYNLPERRNCKISREQSQEIRLKYSPNTYGKKRLAKEFGVSKAVITRILNNQSWRTIKL
jgi:hypothetical protein